MRFDWIRLFAAMLILIVCAAPALARNRVRQEDFRWRVLATPHFDIHFYGDEMEPRAREAGGWLEGAFDRITAEWKIRIRRRIPVFLYRSHNHFEQTNISTVFEGVAAFAEAARDRIVLPVYASPRFMQLVLEHELTHVITFAALFSYRIPSFPLLKNFLLPDWFMEGIAEYQAPYMDSVVQMLLRDAALDNRLFRMYKLRGFAHLNPHEVVPAYEQSARFLEFIEATLGKGSVRRLLGVYGQTVPWWTDSVFAMAFGRSIRSLDREFREKLMGEAEEKTRGKADPHPRARGLTRIGHYRAFHRSPRWSPDGKRIAFVSDRSDQTSLYVMNADGAARRSLLRGRLNRSIERIEGAHAALDWSPDGKSIAFVGEWINDAYLYVIDVDSPRRMRKFLLPFDEIRGPAFSPDGGRIAFSGVRAGVSDIHVLDLASGRTEAITRDRHDDNAPDWSPDGGTIAYQSERDAQTDLFRVDVKTRRIQPLTHTLSMERTPVWSPDGTKILYSSDAGGIYNLHVLDVAAGAAWRLSDVMGGAFGAAWNPDGSEIVFSYYRHGNMTLYRMGAGTEGEAKAITAEDDRKGEYDRYSIRSLDEAPVREFRDRFAAEFLLPLVFVNIATFSDLRRNHVVELDITPTFSSNGAGVVGSLTYWDRSFRTDLGVSIFATDEFSEDDLGRETEDTTVGAGVLARYPLNTYVSLTGGYEVLQEREFVDEIEVRDRILAGPFAIASYSNVVGRGLDAVSGHRLLAGAFFYDESYGADERQTQWTLDYSRFFPITRDNILAGHVELTGIDGPAAVDLDVARVVRGVRTDRFEGQRRFGASLEYRFPILRDIDLPVLGEAMMLKDIRGFIFADAGFATLLSIDAVAGDLDHPDWKASVGAGLRLDLFVLQSFPLQLSFYVAKVEGEAGLAKAVTIGTRF